MVIILAVDSKQPICGAEAHTRLKVGSDSQARVTAGLPQCLLLVSVSLRWDPEICIF